MVATIVFALLWGLVAARTSTTTYHLAPLLVAGGRRAARGRRIRSVSGVQRGEDLFLGGQV